MPTKVALKLMEFAATCTEEELVRLLELLEIVEESLTGSKKE